MKETDARKLGHKTLEEIRIRAVQRVEAGESPEVVIKALGFSRSCIYVVAGQVFFPPIANPLAARLFDKKSQSGTLGYTDDA